MTKISGILIGIVLIGLFSGIISTIVNNMTSSFESTEFNEFDQSEQVNAEVGVLKESLEKISSGNTGIFDIIGLLFQSAYSSAKLLFINSLDMMLKTVTKGFSYIGLENSIAQLTIGAIGTIILIVVVVKILLSTLFKVEQ